MSGIIDSGTMRSSLVVLGAGGTVGHGVVEAALAEGRAVVAVGMDDTAGQALRERHPSAQLLALDATVASDADAAALAARLRALQIRIDGVVASLAGVHPCGRLVDEAAEVLQRTLDQDLLPHLFAARHLLPLLPHDAAGYVLVGGPGGRYPWAGYGHCSIAAAALRMMARVLHEEAGRQGQRVQLLSLDAPVGADLDRVRSVGRRALAMLEAARECHPAAIVDYVDPPPRPARPFRPPALPPQTSSRAGHAQLPVSARDLQAARALLDSISPPTDSRKLPR